MSKHPASSLIHSLCAALLIMSASAEPALAASYVITLFPQGGSAGTGGFQFDNIAGEGCFVTNNPSVMINGQTLDTPSTQDEFCVEVEAVEFTDNKTNAPDGPNNISGQFVEGLTGTLEGVGGNRITFLLNTNNSDDPSDFVRMYGGIVGGQPVFGTYAVTNELNTVAEPGILALFGLGLGSLAWLSRRRSKH